MRLRYGSVWVRATVGLLVTSIVSAGLAAGFFDDLENRIYAWFMAGSQFGSTHLPLAAEIGVVLLVCLIPVAVRMDQPLVLIACCLGVAFVNGLIASLVLLIYDILLPLTPSFLALMGCLGLLECLAWNEERARRKGLEILEASRQQLTDMLVHDLKRRMSSILMGLSVLKREGDSSVARRNELMDTIRASAERMLLLTGNLLGIRRMENAGMVLQREKMLLHTLIQESLRDHGSASMLVGVTLRTINAADIEVCLDKSLMLRVMSNLIWNAIQHAPEGSAIELSYGPDGDNHAIISVANRGSVIAQEDMGRFFNTFESGSSGPRDSLIASTGLGLTFCRMAVEAHHGTIALESPWSPHPDGVKATVRLPLK